MSSQKTPAAAGPPAASERKIALRALAAGNPAGALHLLLETIRKDPGYGEAYLHLADAYLQCGEQQEALAALWRAGTLMPARPDVWRRLAGLCRRAKCPGEAVFAYRRLLELAPADPEATAALGELAGVPPVDRRDLAPTASADRMSAGLRRLILALLALLSLGAFAYLGMLRIVWTPRARSASAEAGVRAGLRDLARLYAEEDYNGFFARCDLHGAPAGVSNQGLPPVQPRPTVQWLKGLRGWGVEELWSVDAVRPLRRGYFWNPHMDSALSETTVRWQKGPTRVTLLWVREDGRWRVAGMRRQRLSP